MVKNFLLGALVVLAFLIASEMDYQDQIMLEQARAEGRL